MRVAIVCPGILPVPPVNGGAVENLIYSLISENEKYVSMELTVFSIYDKKAEKEAKRYQNTRFAFIHTPLLLGLLDHCIHWIAKNVLRKKKNMSYRYIMQRLHFIRKTADMLHDSDYDRVVFENHPTLFMTLKRKGNAQKYAGKYDFHLHNIVTKDFGCGTFLEGCNKVISVSHYINKALSTRYPRITEGQLTVLRNCVDTTRFSRNLSTQEKIKVRLKYGLTQEDKVVLFTGRLTPEKGIRELLEAFSQIKKENAKLLIVGSYFFASDTESEFEKELKALTEDMAGRVIFTGFVPYQKMQECYAIADFVVLPSVWNDPAPLTVIESMACGLPVITTNSGGIPEYANKRCAIILERDDKLTEHLTESINCLLSNKSLCEEMSRFALEAAKNMDLDSYYQNFVRSI